MGLLALTAVVAYQVRAIIRHPHSAVRAIEALAITVPVFLLLFAATYFMMEQANPDNFNVDSLVTAVRTCCGSSRFGGTYRPGR